MVDLITMTEERGYLARCVCGRPAGVRTEDDLVGIVCEDRDCWMGPLTRGLKAAATAWNAMMGALHTGVVWPAHVSIRKNGQGKFTADGITGLDGQIEYEDVDAVFKTLKENFGGRKI